MHASIWRYPGDPDDLLRRYDSMVAEVPIANMRLHLCARDSEGIVVVDTCPTRDAFETFVAGPLRELRLRHGLPEPERVDDFPVHAAFAAGVRLT